MLGNCLQPFPLVPLVLRRKSLVLWIDKFSKRIIFFLTVLSFSFFSFFAIFRRNRRKRGGKFLSQTDRFFKTKHLRFTTIITSYNSLPILLPMASPFEQLLDRIIKKKKKKKEKFIENLSHLESTNSSRNGEFSRHNSPLIPLPSAISVRSNKRRRRRRRVEKRKGKEVESFGRFSQPVTRWAINGDFSSDNDAQCSVTRWYVAGARPPAVSLLCWPAMGAAHHYPPLLTLPYKRRHSRSGMCDGRSTPWCRITVGSRDSIGVATIPFYLAVNRRWNEFSKIIISICLF